MFDVWEVEAGVENAQAVAAASASALDRVRERNLGQREGRRLLKDRVQQRAESEKEVLGARGADERYQAIQRSARGRAPPSEFPAKTSFLERTPAFSPDARWMAYDSNESGRVEEYAQACPWPGGTWQVSTNGGAVSDRAGRGAGSP